MKKHFNALAKKARSKTRYLLPALMISGAVLTTGAAAPDSQGANDSGPTTTDIPARVLALHENAAEICAPLNGGGLNTQAAKRITAIHDTLIQSETGKYLVDFANDNLFGKTWICLSDGMDVYGEYQSGFGVIDLPESDGHDQLVGTSAHELRHAWQEEAGLGSLENLHLDNWSYAIALLAGEADSEAIAAQVMWELKENGIKGPFARHNSQERCDLAREQEWNCYNDITNAFSAAVAADPKALENGAALRAAFKQWYEDAERPASYEMQVFYKAMSGVVEDPEGEPLPEYKSPNGSPWGESIRPGDLDHFGELPHKGTNYLKQGGGFDKIMKGKKRMLPEVS